MLRIFVFSTLLGVVSAGLFGFTQSVAVRGKLMCNDKPAGHVKVKLYDEDPLHDDHLDSGESNADGHFSLRGTDNEVTTLDAKVNIYHDCDDGFTPCQRRITIYIPDKYVTKGSNAENVYDAGVIQLAGKFSGETRDCLNRL